MSIDVVASSSPSARAQSARGSDEAGSFFRYHGVWAPGVRLFRALGFRAKALIISAVFAAPLALVCFNYYSSQNDLIAFSAKERDGVVYARATMELFDASSRWRAALANGGGSAEAAADAKKAAARVQDVEAKLGKDLGTAKQFAAVQTAVAAVGAAAPGKTGEAATALVDALHELLGQVTDGSNLALDPDLDTYYLMDGSLMNLPALVDNTERLRLGAIAALLGGAQGSDEMRQMGAYESRGDLFEERVSSGLAKVAGVRPEAPARLKSETPIKMLHAYHDETHIAKSAAELNEKGAMVAREMLALQGRMLDMLDDLLAARVDRMRGAMMRDTILILLSLAIAAYLFLCFRKVLQGGLDEVVRHVDAMREGDLTTRPNARGADEVARVMQRLLDMQESLTGIVSQVRQSAHVLDSSAQAIGTDSTELAARSEESAASLEQTAATMEELSATVMNNSERSKEAAAIATANADAAARGHQVMEGVNNAMEAVQASSKQIGDIISVIDGIAFQTNILALNAAVEAARAGEQGKGFAVVASEVRALAQRSAVAANEIKQLITATLQHVQSASGVSSDARAAIGEVLGSAQRLRQLINDISLGADEQSSGIAQISAAIQELDRATQENARLVDRTAHAANTMRENSGRLAERVDQFKLIEG